MFGYVTICREAMSEEGRNIFNAYYCGLCKATGRMCSHAARMGLSYDITFLAIVLSSVVSETPKLNERKCLLHPVRGKYCVENDAAVDYAACMGVILTYLKLLDDWRDERSVKALCAMMFFYRGVRKAKRRYKTEYDKIKKCLDTLSALERDKCLSVDETADCFAKILEILFTPEFIADNNMKRSLAWLGYNIGRWIYIIDAYNDIEKDIKKDNYNVLAAANKGISSGVIKRDMAESIEASLTFTLENAASAYDLLDIHKNKEILDNIIYTALKEKQKYILGGSNGSV